MKHVITISVLLVNTFTGKCSFLPPLRQEASSYLECFCLTHCQKPHVAGILREEQLLGFFSFSPSLCKVAPQKI